MFHVISQFFEFFHIMAMAMGESGLLGLRFAVPQAKILNVLQTTDDFV